MRADKEHFGNLSQWNWLRFMNGNCNFGGEYNAKNMLERLFKKKDYLNAV